MYVPHLCQVPQEDQKNDLDPLELELQMATMWVWEQNPGPSEKQQALLTAESSLSPKGTFLSNCQVMCPFKGISNENGLLFFAKHNSLHFRYHSIKHCPVLRIWGILKS